MYIIAGPEFELAYFKNTVQNFSHYVAGTLSEIICL